MPRTSNDRPSQGLESDTSQGIKYVVSSTQPAFLISASTQYWLTQLPPATRLFLDLGGTVAISLRDELTSVMLQSRPPTKDAP